MIALERRARLRLHRVRPKNRSRSLAQLAALLPLVLTACGDDGPPKLLIDDSWSTQREVHIDDFILQPWSADAFEATDMAFLPDGRALLTTKGGWNGPGNGEVVLLAGDGTTVGTVLTLPVCGDAERGLLGIEVDPDFDENQRFYVYYTKGTSDCAIYHPLNDDPGDAPVENRVSSFVFSDTGVDPASETVLLDHLTAGASAHNAGGLSFMPDGTLLVGVGEAGTRLSRDLDSPYGKILRLDVDRPGEGAADNPFYDPAQPDAVRSLVYASGLRNPFRVAADPVTGAVAVADVGTDVHEEINLITPGYDYGYPEVEGPSSDNGSALPALWFTHENGCNSIIGGDWLPARWMPDLATRGYVFTDFGCGGVYLAEFDGDRVSVVYEIGPRLGYSLARVLVGPDSSVYLVGVGPGPFQVQRLYRDPLAR